MTKTSFLCTYDPTTDQLKYDLTRGVDTLDTASRDTVINAVGYVIGGMNTAITQITPSGHLSSLFTNTHSFLIEFPYDYAVNLQRAKQEYGDAGYQAELVAAGKAIISIGTGVFGSEAGQAIGTLIISTTPAGRIGGAIIGGVLSSGIYDQYLEKPVDEFFNDIVIPSLQLNPSRPDTSRVAIGYQNEGSTELTTDLITVHQSQSSDPIIATSGDNILNGNAGTDNIFYIPTFNGQNIINDPDGTGIIKIGNPPVILDGNAIPKKDAAGNIIPGQWTLNGYDLIRSGDNLVIILAGSDISSPDTPRITINNFPFSNPNAFGLLLGKKVAGLSSTNTFRSDSSAFSGNVFGAIADKRGRFFAPALVARGSAGEKDYAIKVYNSEGFVVGTQKLTNLPQSTYTKTFDVQTIGQSGRLQSGNVGLVYTVNEIETDPITGAFVAGNSKAYETNLRY